MWLHHAFPTDFWCTLMVHFSCSPYMSKVTGKTIEKHCRVHKSSLIFLLCEIVHGHTGFRHRKMNGCHEGMQIVINNKQVCFGIPHHYSLHCRHKADRVVAFMLKVPKPVPTLIWPVNVFPAFNSSFVEPVHTDASEFSSWLIGVKPHNDAVVDVVVPCQGLKSCRFWVAFLLTMIVQSYCGLSVSLN